MIEAGFEKLGVGLVVVVVGEGRVLALGKIFGVVLVVFLHGFIGEVGW